MNIKFSYFLYKKNIISNFKEITRKPRNKISKLVINVNFKFLYTFIFKKIQNAE